jgi:hypothetical protein
MNNFPRLGYFDIDPDKFAAMIEEFKREDVIDMADHSDPIWDDVIEDNNVEDYYDDSMDGDFDSAMASAGFGTDEDYGMFDDYNDFYGEE